MSSFSPSSSATTSQIPALAPSDIAHAISLIQAAYAPTAASDLPALQSLQSALLAMHRTPAAWGLIVPLLAHEDVNVQFFGAHTVHYVKISWGEMATVPHEEQAALREVLSKECVSDVASLSFLPPLSRHTPLPIRSACGRAVP
jgi:hypothetical protein